MGNLRIKLKYKSFEIELEGDKDTVQSEFKDIKENGLGNIVMGVDLSEQNLQINSGDPNQSSIAKQLPQTEIIDFEEDNGNVPSIKDVIMKQIPSSETEWIIVYAFYASNNGEKTFTTKDILTMYESTKRDTTSRKSNLSNNIKTIFNKGYFSALNDDDFILTDDGKHNAIEIVTRTHTTPTKQTKPKVKKVVKETKETKASKNSNLNTSRTKKSSNQFEVLKTLNFRPADKISLTDYIDKYDVNSNPDRIIVIINYLKDILKVEKVTGNHIYTAFWVLKCKIPTSFNQVMINTRGRSKYIDYETLNEITLSIPGANRIRLDINKN